MELHQLDIFPDDYHRPDLVITYTMNDDQEIDMLKIWISYKHRKNIEFINYANLLLYSIVINNNKEKVTQRDIYIAYQRLFGFKQWKSYKESKTFINNVKTLTKAPYSKYIEVTKEYINNTLNETYNKYIKKEKGELQL